MSTSALTLALACNGKGKGEKNQNSKNRSNITGRHDCTDRLKCAFILYRPSASWWSLDVWSRRLDNSSGSSDLRKSYLWGFPELCLPSSTIRVWKRKKGVQVVRVAVCLAEERWNGHSQHIKNQNWMLCTLYEREIATINIQQSTSVSCPPCDLPTIWRGTYWMMMKSPLITL